MLDIGLLSLLMSFITVLTSFILILVGSKLMNIRVIRDGFRMVLLHMVFLTISVVFMVYYLVTRNFQVAYVAMYTDRNLPLTYTVSALWAGHSGSLLFWSWLLSLFTAIFIAIEKRDALTYTAVAFMALINVFFTGFLVLVSNPFLRLEITPLDGEGLNPLLQNFGMLLHPPMLFVGYTALTIPYSLAMAGLVNNSEFWILRARKWTLIGWFTLSLGIMFGAAWSYVVLGWGGYWAWDPVENASLIPWLISTALLHSFMVQESRRGMKLWNILLAIFAFEAVIFATFITRSGILVSIHSFSITGVGPVFTGFLLTMLALSFTLVTYRYESLTGRDIYESLFGRELSFLFNNLLLVVITVTVFWGTIYPLLIEAVTGAAVGVGPGFYETIFRPFFMGIVALMGFCVALKWRYTEHETVLRRITISVGLGGLFALTMVTMGYGSLIPTTSFSIAGFAFFSHAIDFIEDLKNYGFKSGIHFLEPIYLILTKRRRYGGYIIHLGVALLLMGYVVSSIYSSSHSISLRIGETVDAEGYKLTLVGIDVTNDDVKTETTAVVEVRDPEDSLVTLKPAIRYYPKFDTTIGKVDIWSKPCVDIYLILQTISEGSARLSVKFIPFVNLLWIGGFGLLVMGFIIACMPRSLVKRIVGVKHA